MATLLDSQRPEPRGRLGVFRRGFCIQMKVIGALVMRELHTRYGRDNVGYVWLFLEPLLLATGVAILHARATHNPGVFSPVAVAIVGYSNFMIFRSIFLRAEGAVEANGSLLYHRSISIFDILLSRSLLDAAGSIVAFTILLTFAIALGFAPVPERLWALMLGTTCIFWFSFGLSMLVCAGSHDRPGIGRLIHPLTYFMLPLGGVFVPTKALPGGWRDVLYWVPLSHCFELLRYGEFSSANLDYCNVPYLFACMGILTLVGLACLSGMRDKVHVL